MKLTEYNPLANRHSLTLHLQITLLSPLSHIGESIGNQSNLRSLKITDFYGEPCEIFAYSGNALRGKILRRCGIDSFLESLNISVNPTIHQTLFAGGFIDGGTGNDLELDRKVRQFIPPLSVLGTAKPKGAFGTKDAQMLSGRLNVGDAYLVCFESARYCYASFPPVMPSDCERAIASLYSLESAFHKARVDRHWGLIELSELETRQREYFEKRDRTLPVLEAKLRPYHDWLTWSQKTRQDSLKDPELLKHLSVAKKAVAGQLSLLEEGNGEQATGNRGREKSQQMIIGDWLLQPGATLYSRWDGKITDIEEGYLVDSLLKWNESPYLGGKGATGCGQVAMQFWFESGQERGEWLSLAPSVERMSDRALTQHQRYQIYLEHYREFLASAAESKEIKELLTGNRQ